MATLDVLTLAEAKQALNLTGTTAHDTELPGWITAASLRLDKLVGPVVRRPVTAERHDGGGAAIFLRHHPNYSITSVSEYDGTTPSVLTVETNAAQPMAGYVVDEYSADASLLSNIVRRRSSGGNARFPQGRRNVIVDYVAGRFADTASCDERAKSAVRIMMLNFWRSQQDSTGQSGEFDVPQSAFPTFAVPRAVRDMYDGEIQDPMFL